MLEILLLLILLLLSINTSPCGSWGSTVMFCWKGRFLRGNFNEWSKVLFSLSALQQDMSVAYEKEPSDLPLLAPCSPGGWWQPCVGSKNDSSLVINHESREVALGLALLVPQMCLMGLADLSVGSVDIKPGWNRTEQHMAHHMLGRPLLHHLSFLYLT